MDDVERELKIGFLEEAEHLTAGLDKRAQTLGLELADASLARDVLERLYRVFHSVRGGAGAAGFGELQMFAYVVELYVLELKKNGVPSSQESAALLADCLSRLEQMLGGLRSEPGAKFNNQSLLARLGVAQVRPACQGKDSHHKSVPIRVGSWSRLSSAVDGLVLHQAFLEEQRTRLLSAGSEPELVALLGATGKLLDELLSARQATARELLAEEAQGRAQPSLKRPVTTGVVDAMVVRVGQERYCVAVEQVVELVRPRREEVVGLRPDRSMLVRGQPFPLLALAELLGRPVRGPEPWDGVALVVQSRLKAPLSVVVDDIVGSQRIVLQPLGPDLQQLPGFAGATVLGDGTAALMLDLTVVVEAAL